MVVRVSYEILIFFQISLELGGNAPCIVFDDADLDVAVKGSVSQSCYCLYSSDLFIHLLIYALVVFLLT